MILVDLDFHFSTCINDSFFSRGKDGGMGGRCYDSTDEHAYCLLRHDFKSSGFAHTC